MAKYIFLRDYQTGLYAKPGEAVPMIGFAFKKGDIVEGVENEINEVNGVGSAAKSVSINNGGGEIRIYIKPGVAATDQVIAPYTEASATIASSAVTDKIKPGVLIAGAVIGAGIGLLWLREYKGAKSTGASIVAVLLWALVGLGAVTIGDIVIKTMKKP